MAKLRVYSLLAHDHYSISHIVGGLPRRNRRWFGINRGKIYIVSRGITSSGGRRGASARRMVRGERLTYLCCAPEPRSLLSRFNVQKTKILLNLYRSIYLSLSEIVVLRQHLSLLIYKMTTATITSLNEYLIIMLDNITICFNSVCDNYLNKTHLVPINGIVKT